LRSFISYAKVNAVKMQFGSAGVGSTPHLACALLNNAIGINVAHIPYRGSAPAMQDLIAGRIDYQCATVAAAIAQIESKTVTPIAMLSQTRSPILPDLASAQEQGLDNFDASAWFAFLFSKRHSRLDYSKA
jgi:tripartite-type tricarboxylate transporter receptor subunit TctC